jgi:hypothetical protein
MVDKETGDVAQAKLPVPEPGDITRAAELKFDDLRAELTKCNSRMKGKCLSCIHSLFIVGLIKF